MSRLSTRTVRAVALLAPASLVVASLAGCAPKHPTTLDSPTPESSQFHQKDGSVEGENTQAEPTSEAASGEASLTESGKDSGVSALGFSENTHLTVKSFTVKGAVSEAKLGGFMLTPSGSGKGTLAVIDQCANETYDVDVQGSDATVTQSYSNVTNCQGEALTAAEALGDFLTSGKLRISEATNGVELTNGQDKLVLRKAD
ncbi:hypothetical protein [Arthrobacter sp. HMSC08H08]|uniref:hypothetical protein n=1 Tax=Arthrobacter sp. HMSC08H08 TaxID=1581143 RepID=UPI0008A4D692|nr:hypothetical protein [Arthrobacter sp. HMSC08H08]OFT23839.1 hypothetical protein HMPREF3175_03145 [Arthrobacter sp. HMSC08H08]